jgi:alpha-beta hydrolase superfamily lysophospholipase
MQFKRDLAARLARYAELAYEEPGDVRARLIDSPANGQTGRELTFLSRGGTQAYVIRLYDITAWEPGKVHRGYAGAYRALSVDLAAILRDTDRPLYFCGHSLGGALATLASTRQPAPTATYTFGSPRVGNGAFAREVRYLFRLVHEDDIAPKFPFFLGYRHGGEAWHLSRRGEISRGVEGLRQWLIPVTRQGIVAGIADHAVSSYRRGLSRRVG